MDNKLLVIYYHEVVPVGMGYSYQKLDIDKFESQMRFLAENGFHSMFFSELSDPLPNKAIIVSFDDGFKTVYENAAEIMKKYGIKGNVYLPTSYIGTNDHFMDWKMISDLVNSGLFEMHAHTHTHVDIRCLDEEKMNYEVKESIKYFNMHLKNSPDVFCIPFGTWNIKSILMLRKTNMYKYILGSHYGRTSAKKLQRVVLPRIGISNDDSISVFQKKLDGRYDWKGPLQIIRLILNNILRKRITKYEF